MNYGVLAPFCPRTSSGAFMTIHVPAFSAAAPLVWGGAVFLASLANILFPSYASTFLHVLESIYQGYTPSSVSGLVIGTLYGLADGAA